MKPRPTVKDLLVGAKDAAELMVDLAYAAVFFADEALASEVLRLEERVDGLMVELRATCMIASRTPQDAEQLAGVLSMAVSIEGIADAAEDIARVVLKDLGIPGQLRDDLRHATEVTARIKIREENELEGARLCDLELPGRTGMWVIAIRRDLDWVFGPSGEEVLRVGDVLFLRGRRDGIDEVRLLAGAVPRELAEGRSEARLTHLDRAVDIVVELKNVAEAAVGLAYSAILLRDPTLASEVSVIEDRSDELFHQLERWVLRAAREIDEPEDLRGLLHLASASERIVDSAQSMCRVIEEETPPHPIIAAALSAAEEIVAEAVVVEGSEVEGNTLGGLRVHTETGMEVLAVQRGGRWIYRPRPNLPLRVDDRLIAIGPDEGARRLRHLSGDHRPESDDGWVAFEEEEFRSG